MNRRDWLKSVALAAAADLAKSHDSQLLAQEGPPQIEPVEKMTAGPGTPAIALCHVGFRPEAKKTLVFRVDPGIDTPKQFRVRDVSSGPRFQIERPLKPVASDLGDALIGDFSDVAREGMYQVQIGPELSVPFFIRPDAWRRTLPTVVSYHHAQRCGTAIPNVHPVCHLDDSRRRDNGEHVDTTGGWHDAGDLRKWMDATMMNGFGLLAIAEHLGDRWDLAGSGLDPLLDEMRWGNVYFHKMQDRDGRVWNDVGGGVNGDNSDNHWTDNKIGTADDRYLNPGKPAEVQAMFTSLQARCATAFAKSDAKYVQICRVAAERCWDANPHTGNTEVTAWWLTAALDMHAATHDAKYSEACASIAGAVAALQQTEFTGNQKVVRGFWRMGINNSEPYKHHVHSALPAYALLLASERFPSHADASKWRDAARLYIDGYVVPMTSRSAYAIVPWGLYRGSPTPEKYRAIDGELTYRYFMPVRKQFYWQGLNAHLESHALLLATAARTFNQPSYRDLAYRQMEWVLGANPFGASLMTGEGYRTPYPHSRYVGLLPGGIMNGICGNIDDAPILDAGYSMTWRTNEYWSPHVGYYEWSQAVLEGNG